SWLSKTAKKLENSAKKRISEGIAIAIQGGPR
nr:Chain A, Cecropin-P1 [Ascaris suum]7DEH_A Chain A, Cecropin-P1 [Ascaris suum]